MDISSVIRDIRRKSLLSQTDFADQVGVSFSTVNRWENGKASPNYKALKSIKAFCTANHIDFDADAFISQK